MASIFFITIVCALLCISACAPSSESNLQTYIIHVEEPTAHLLNDLPAYYESFLPVADTLSSEAPRSRIIYPYRFVLTGFAARLTQNEVEAMKEMEGFISAWPDRKLSFHTTHSPQFLGLSASNTGLWKQAGYGKGVVIGILDSGIKPDHPSFNVTGMSSPPSTWRGKCEFRHPYHCNNKIIGARDFVVLDENEIRNPLDEVGHGTHTASTAAGNFVDGANLFGSAAGTAAGIAPHAHLAIYKVCDTDGCPYTSIVAAIDAAVEDGVDVLSISLGNPAPLQFYEDPVLIASFRVMEHGIVVSFSAGNHGPEYYNVINGVPWALTVGASTMDRQLRATVVLRNKPSLLFNGEAAYQPKDFRQEFLPLVYATNCTSDYSLKRSKVKGKIVVCDYHYDDKGPADSVKREGGAAMILVNVKEVENTTIAVHDSLPAANIGYADGLEVKRYINSTVEPKAKIVFQGTLLGDDRAPEVTAFSSRGPNIASLGILKPDILGPGVNILAAWPTSVENKTNVKSTFNVLSGTSMSCPHLSGVAAMLKSTHPDWSPAAIKSAILTTADVVNRAGQPIEDANSQEASIFATGSGHVNPQAANDPGLVYDIEPKDYIPYLCGLNYTNRQVRRFWKHSMVDCSKVRSIPGAQLNYPSFVLNFTEGKPVSQKYTRTVTNVGPPKSTYRVFVVPPVGIKVLVEPKTLNFSKLNEKSQYQVTFTRLATAPNKPFVQGFLKWSYCKYTVRSPIAAVLEGPQSWN
ncbi:Subtilisin-like protease SBT1.2 [Striga hermonthica]|uniref:Subtilisin-like protease SBT1.2 n=1 Tax=Striga hermonthica TaxID=68872 RepID=A0A9N7MZJ8_STRHE|nr:Subtilisin-like protease SBT1.2 [Striga hermonthica]